MSTQGKDPKDRNDPARRGGQTPSAMPSKHDRSLQEEAEGKKATRFDGNPNVDQAPDGALGPQDDTPWKLKKKD